MPGDGVVDILGVDRPQLHELGDDAVADLEDVEMAVHACGGKIGDGGGGEGAEGGVDQRLPVLGYHRQRL